VPNAINLRDNSLSERFVHNTPSRIGSPDGGRSCLAATRLAAHLPRSGFHQRFVAKGRFEALMASLPVKLIIHPQPGLQGAAAAFAETHR